MHTWLCHCARFLALGLLLCARPFEGSSPKPPYSEDQREALVSVCPKEASDATAPAYYTIGLYRKMVHEKWLLAIKDAIAGNAHSILLQSQYQEHTKKVTWRIQHTAHVESKSVQETINTWLESMAHVGDALYISAADKPGRAVVKFLQLGVGADSFTATVFGRLQGHWQLQMDNNALHTCHPIAQTSDYGLVLAAAAVAPSHVSLSFCQLDTDLVACDAQLVLKYGPVFGGNALLRSLLQKVVTARANVSCVYTMAGKDEHQVNLLFKAYPSKEYVQSIIRSIPTDASKLREFRVFDRRGEATKSILRGISSHTWYLYFDHTQSLVIQSFSAFEAAVKTKCNQPQMPLVQIMLKPQAYVAKDLFLLHQLEIASSLYAQVVSAFVRHVIFGPSTPAVESLHIIRTVIARADSFTLDMGFQSDDRKRNARSW